MCIIVVEIAGTAGNVLIGVGGFGFRGICIWAEVIEDTPTFGMAKIMLTRLGYTVLETKDGAETVDIFQKHQDDVLCVLSDLTMPRIDGWDTLAALRRLSSDIPVILSSGYAETKVMAEEHTEIPNVFLGKPYQLKGLRVTINRVLTDPAEDNGQLNTTN